MEQFNINEIIETYKLNADELSKLLFPYVKYPKQAFDRILKGEATLDIEQVQKLATHIGVLVYDLFTINSWKGSRDEDDCLVFTKGIYKAKLNYNSTFITLYKNNEVYKTVIAHNQSMVSMNDFTNLIDKLIKEN